MTNEEFEQLEFEHAEAITRAEQVYRDTEGDLSRAVIAAIQSLSVREMTVDEVAEIMLIGIAFENGREHELDDSAHVANYRRDAVGAAKALANLGTIRIKEEV